MKKQKILLSVIVVLFWFALGVCRPYQTPYLSALGVGEALIGTVLGAYGVAQMILRVPAGVLADTASRQKAFVILGACFSCGASVFRLVMDNAVGYFLANLLGGTAAALWTSFMILYLNFYTREEQQRATARIFIFSNLGLLVSFGVGTVLYDRIHMYGLSLMSCAVGGVAVLLSLFLEEIRMAAELDKPSPVRLLRALLNKRLIFFSVLTIIQKGIEFSTATAFTNQIVEELSGSSFLVGCSSVVYMVSSVAFSAFASSRICAKKRPVVWVVSGFLCAAVYCVLVVLVRNVYIILLLQILPGMVTGVLLSYLTGEAVAEAPAEAKSTFMGFFQAVYSVGITGLPMLVGKVAGDVSMQAGYYVLAIGALICAAAAYIYYRRNGRFE